MKLQVTFHMQQLQPQYLPQLAMFAKTKISPDISGAIAFSALDIVIPFHLTFLTYLSLRTSTPSYHVIAQKRTGFAAAQIAHARAVGYAVDTSDISHLPVDPGASERTSKVAAMFITFILTITICCGGTSLRANVLDLVCVTA